MLVLKYSKASFTMLGWLTEFKGFSATIVTELPVKTLNEIEYYGGFERKLRSNSKVCADQRGVHKSRCAFW